MTYDSTADTQEHIDHVRTFIQQVVEDLVERGARHDASKLEEPEKAIFDEYTPKLAQTTYGSVEYFENLKGMKVALDHHYEHNRHHPEHYGEDLVNGMTLMDLVEMLCDWKAASLRFKDGKQGKLQMDTERFRITPQLANILQNTVNELWPD